MEMETPGLYGGGGRWDHRRRRARDVGPGEPTALLSYIARRSRVCINRE